MKRFTELFPGCGRYSCLLMLEEEAQAVRRIPAQQQPSPNSSIAFAQIVADIATQINSSVLTGALQENVAVLGYFPFNQLLSMAMQNFYKNYGRDALAVLLSCRLYVKRYQRMIQITGSFTNTKAEVDTQKVYIREIMYYQKCKCFKPNPEHSQLSRNIIHKLGTLQEYIPQLFQKVVEASCSQKIQLPPSPNFDDEGQQPGENDEDNLPADSIIKPEQAGLMARQFLLDIKAHLIAFESSGDFNAFVDNFRFKVLPLGKDEYVSAQQLISGISSSTRGRRGGTDESKAASRRAKKTEAAKLCEQKYIQALKQQKQQVVPPGLVSQTQKQNRNGSRSQGKEPQQIRNLKNLCLFLTRSTLFFLSRLLIPVETAVDSKLVCYHFLSKAHLKSLEARQLNQAKFECKEVPYQTRLHTTLRFALKPNTNRFRPIMGCGRYEKELNYNLKVQPLLQVLQQNFKVKYPAFNRTIQEVAGYHFRIVDVISAFDVIEQQRLYEIAIAHIQQRRYSVLDYTVLADGKLVPSYAHKMTYQEVVLLLKEAIFETSFTFAKKTYLLTRGVPQGSCLSSAFCYLYFDFILKEIAWKYVIEAQISARKIAADLNTLADCSMHAPKPLPALNPVWTIVHVDDIIVYGPSKEYVDVFVSALRGRVAIREKDVWCGQDLSRQVYCISYQEHQHRIPRRAINKVLQMERFMRRSMRAGCTAGAFWELFKDFAVCCRFVMNNAHAKRLSYHVMNSTVKLVKTLAKRDLLTISQFKRARQNAFTLLLRQKTLCSAPRQLALIARKYAGKHNWLTRGLTSAGPQPGAPLQSTAPAASRPAASAPPE